MENCSRLEELQCEKHVHRDGDDCGKRTSRDFPYKCVKRPSGEKPTATAQGLRSRTLPCCRGRAEGVPFARIFVIWRVRSGSTVAQNASFWARMCLLGSELCSTKFWQSYPQNYFIKYLHKIWYAT